MNNKILTGALLCLLLVLGACIQIKVVEDEAIVADEVSEDVNETAETAENATVESEENVTEEVVEDVNATEEIVEEANATAVIENATEVSENVTEVTNETEEAAEEEVTEEIENATPLDEIKTAGEGISVTEGELISLKVSATDPDGNALSYSFSEPFDENGEWETEDGDEGIHNVTVTVTDSEGLSSSMDVQITVLPMNHAPVIEDMDTITVDEGDIIELEPIISDEDGDELTITYSGWMESTTYETDYDDEGEYTVTVTATDGELTVSKDITVVVNNKNRAPVIGSITLS